MLDDTRRLSDTFQGRYFSPRIGHLCDNITENKCDRPFKKSLALYSHTEHSEYTVGRLAGTQMSLRLPYSRALTPKRKTPNTIATETLPSCIFKLNAVDEDTVRLQSPMVPRTKWTDQVAVRPPTGNIYGRKTASQASMGLLINSATSSTAYKVAH